MKITICKIFLLLMALFFYSCRRVTRDEAVENFLKNKESFYSLMNYLDSVKPKQPRKGIHFEIPSSGKYDLAIIYEDGSIIATDPNIGGRDMKLSSKKMDTLLNLLGWDRKVILKLEEKLNNTNCESVTTGDPFRMYFGEAKSGYYTYLIYKKPVSDSFALKREQVVGDTFLDKRALIIYSYSGF